MGRQASRIGPRRLVQLAVAGGMAFACASAARVEEVPRQEVVAYGRSAQVLVVLPLNVPVAMPEGLEGPSLAVWTELENHLRAHDKQLKTVSYPDARRLWLLSAGRARRSSEDETADFADAARLMAQELRRYTEFDALIIPSVFVQEATVHGRWAVWDGVNRPIDVHRDPRRLHPNALRASRTARSASLHVAVFDARGRRIHEGQGGLDLLVRVRLDAGLSESLASSDFQYYEMRPEVFDDPALLREGVAQALDPFLSAEVPEREPL